MQVVRFSGVACDVSFIRQRHYDRPTGTTDVSVVQPALSLLLLLLPVITSQPDMS